MNRTENDRDRITDEYEALHASLVKLAKHSDDLVDDEACKDILTPDLFEVWSKFVKPFDDGSFDIERIADISARMDDETTVDILSFRAPDSDITPDEEALLNELRSVEVNDEDAEYYNEYRSSLEAQAIERVGGNIGALELVRSAQRFCRLVSIGAPGFIIDSEALRLAQSMAVHAFAESPLRSMILGD